MAIDPATRGSLEIDRTQTGDRNGSLLAAIEGRGDWPHNVFKLYWPVARADSFAASVSAL